jgi:flagellar biosynthesis chaperone FliJ
LAARNAAVSSLQAKLAELERDLDHQRHEQRSFGSSVATKERDAQRKITGLQDELDHAEQQISTLEKMVKDKAAALSEAKDKASMLLLWRA